MNIKKVFIVGLMAAAASALADVTITGVSAKQRYPWNGLIDMQIQAPGSDMNIDSSDCYECLGKILKKMVE